jgi:DNA-binding FrmR family transcriptional regulator
MKNSNKTRVALVNHISRIEGQLAAIKRELSKASPDCEKASNMVCASSRSFASLRRGFVQCFLEENNFIKNVAGAHRTTYESLLRVVHS